MVENTAWVFRSSNLQDQYIPHDLQLHLTVNYSGNIRTHEYFLKSLSIIILIQIATDIVNFLLECAFSDGPLELITRFHCTHLLQSKPGLNHDHTVHTASAKTTLVCSPNVYCVANS